MGMEEILKKLESIEQNMATKEDLEKLATQEDVMRVADTLADTLQSITSETAVSLQDKQEAGDVLLKSLTDGLREEMHQRFNSVDERFDKLESRFDGLEGRFDKLENTMLEGFNRIAKIMETWIEKQKMIDSELHFHLQKIINNEKATEDLQRRVKELESGFGS